MVFYRCGKELRAAVPSLLGQESKDYSVSVLARDLYLSARYLFKLKYCLCIETQLKDM